MKTEIPRSSNFAQYKGHNSSLSSLFYSHSNNVPLNHSDHSLLQLLDKLDKQDPTTRLKGARSITELLRQKNITDYRVEKFVFIFGKLALVEPDPLVRIALSETLEQYFIDCKKSFQSFFKSNYFLIKSCSYDESQKVANSYVKAISALGNEKVLNNIYNYVKDDLSTHIKIILNKPYTEYIKKWKKSFNISNDQLEKCYSRYITAIFKFILLDIHLTDYPNIWNEICDIIWNFLGFSSFETTNPFSIRLSALMLIQRAIELNAHITPKNIDLIPKSLRVLYNTGNEYIAENTVKLFKNLMNVELNNIDIKHTIKQILLDNNNFNKSDNRFGNKNFCITITEIIVSFNDYFYDLIPKFITQIQDFESLEKLIKHYNSTDDVLKLLLDKISNILKSENVSSSILLNTLTDLIVNNFDVEKINISIIPQSIDYIRVIPFIPSIIKLKSKFNQNSDDLIKFIILDMIPLLSNTNKFSNTLINKLISAMDVFQKCKNYYENFNFNEIKIIEFYPLSLNINTTTGLEDRILMDIKLSKSYYQYLYKMGIKIDIKSSETIFDKDFWIACLKYFIGIINKSIIIEMIPKLSNDSYPFIKILIAQENFNNNELFFTCYNMSKYELASILSNEVQTHLLCLKAGYPPESCPLASYISKDIIESLIYNVINTSICNVSIEIISKKLPDLYIETLYKVIFLDGIGRFTFEELCNILKLIKIISFDAINDNLIDFIKQLSTLSNIIECNFENNDLDYNLMNEMLLNINLTSDLYLTYKFFSKNCRGIYTISEYIMKKLLKYNTELSELFERVLRNDEICEKLYEMKLPKDLEWLIQLVILDSIDSISNSPYRFKYCLNAYVKALNELDINSLYFMFKFCKKFIIQFDKLKGENDLNKLKFSFSEYIQELSQIITLINPYEFEYDSRCFILSLFYSIQNIEKIKFIDELNEYLQDILYFLHPIYFDILIGSKDQDIIKLSLVMFGKLIKSNSNLLIKQQNFDSELDLISESNSENQDKIFKKSSEYQYELESRYPNFLKILLGYIESVPSIYVSAWKILIELDSTISFPNYDQLDVFINEIISIYINNSYDVSEMNVLIFKRFPQYILDRMDNDEIKYFFSDISPDLIQSEVELMNKWKITASFKGLTVTGILKVDNIQSIDFKIHFTEDYPFKEAVFNVNKNEMKGVSKKQVLSWLESSKYLLKLGKIALAVKNIKENITQFYKGVSECNICLASFHTESKTFANKKCQVCKNTFHSFCLLRWFRTSHKPKCPICQSHTAIAFPRRINTSEKQL